jgi:hypothetical protein
MRDILGILILALLAVIKAQNITSLPLCGVSTQLLFSSITRALAFTAIAFPIILRDEHLST